MHCNYAIVNATEQLVVLQIGAVDKIFALFPDEPTALRVLYQNNLDQSHKVVPITIQLNKVNNDIINTKSNPTDDKNQ